MARFACVPYRLREAIRPPFQPKMASNSATVAPLLAARVAPILRTPCAYFVTPCGAQKLVMQQRVKCGVTLQAQVGRRSLGMLAEGGALLRRMERLGPTSGAVASDCNRRRTRIELDAN